MVTRDERISRGHIEELRHLVGVEGVRQAPSRLRRADFISRVAGQRAFAYQIIAEAAYRAEPPLNAAFKSQLVDWYLHRVYEELDGPLTDAISRIPPS